MLSTGRRGAGIKSLSSHSEGYINKILFILITDYCIPCGGINWTFKFCNLQENAS